MATPPDEGLKFKDVNFEGLKPGALRNDPGKFLSTGTESLRAAPPDNPAALSKDTYSSYAGVDIVAHIILPGESPLILGELQTLSYSIHRENKPVRYVGHVNPMGFVRGPRTIAGSLIFTVFNSYAFYRIEKYKNIIIRPGQSLYPLADMLPPFDIILTFSNETGSFSKMKIYGVTIVDEGQTVSIDDLITEQTYTFMARGIQPMTHFLPDGFTRSTSTVSEYGVPRSELRFT